MIRTLSENRWFKALLYVLAFVVLIILVLYLSGYFYLIKLRYPPLRATPLTIIQYWVYYGQNPHVKSWLILCSFASTALVFAPVVALLKPARKALHGDARLATTRDVKKAGLLQDRGIILGKHRSKYIMLAGQQGVVCAAPPRSGKGVGLVIPNMLNWCDSVVIMDIRKEAWRVTSGYRAKHGQEVYLFNPLAEDGKTCRWNTLSYVSADPNLRINDLQKISSFFFPDPVDKDTFWMASCRVLFLGLALYVFETPGLPTTVGEILRQIMYGEAETVGDHWKKIIEKREKAGQPLSDVCSRSLYDFIMTSTNTQSSIRKTFTAALELWQNPMVDAATSGDSFDLRDLRRKRISLYIGVTPDNLERLGLINNLLFQQILDLNTREMPEDNVDLKYQLLLMMDEFTAVGKLPILSKSISYMGGYNIRIFVIVQGPSQLRSVYGADVAETIMTCVAAQVVFAPKEQRQANEISESIGFDTVKTKTFSRPAMFGHDSHKRHSMNISEQRRALFLPQEIKEIGKHREIIFMENVRPILAEKIVYYKDREFKKRLLPPIEVEPLILPSLAFSLNYGSGASQASISSEIREITAEDLQTMDNLDLSDFSCNFDDIEIPKDPISDEEMKRVVDDLIQSMGR